MDKEGQDRDEKYIQRLRDGISLREDAVGYLFHVESPGRLEELKSDIYHASRGQVKLAFFEYGSPPRLVSSINGKVAVMLHSSTRSYFPKAGEVWLCSIVHHHEDFVAIEPHSRVDFVRKLPL